jgi:hypothetical protein
MARLKRPMRLVMVATLLLVYAAAFAKIAAIFGAVCFLNLAWHLRRQESVADPMGQPAGPGPVAYPNRMRRIVRGALLLGITSTGIQAQRNLVGVGWSEAAALVTSLVVAVAVGILLWVMVTAIFRGYR